MRVRFWEKGIYGSYTLLSVKNDVEQRDLDRGIHFYDQRLRLMYISTHSVMNFISMSMIKIWLERKIGSIIMIFMIAIH